MWQKIKNYGQTKHKHLHLRTNKCPFSERPLEGAQCQHKNMRNKVGNNKIHFFVWSSSSSILFSHLCLQLEKLKCVLQMSNCDLVWVLVHFSSDLHLCSKCLCKLRLWDRFPHRGANWHPALLQYQLSFGPGPIQNIIPEQFSSRQKNYPFLICKWRNTNQISCLLLL